MLGISSVRKFSINNKNNLNIRNILVIPSSHWWVEGDAVL